MNEKHFNKPGGLYEPVAVTTGPLLHCAGQTARRGETMIATGIVGEEVTFDVACECARQCVENLLAHARKHLGDYARIQRVVRVTVYVAAGKEFQDHSRIADAASARLVDELGERGVHVRTTIGVPSLPRRSPVEVDCIFEIKV